MSQQITKGNILVIDDTPANLRVLSNMLAERGYKVRSAINGELALRAARAAPPDLVLLDINMPGMDGYEVCEHLKADARTREIPIVFISALDEIQDKVKAFTVGGVDYITKPFQFEEVLARVQTHLALRSLQCELQQQIEAKDRLIAELDAYAHTVAHDLKNPLAAQIGFLSLLEARLASMSPEKISATLQRTTQIAYKMTNIIDELLLLTSVRKMAEIEICPLDMGQVVDEALGRLTTMVDEAQAEVITPATWPSALGHAPWVEEVWANYISNALKYGGQPPQVELGAAEVSVTSECAPQARVRFWVRDNGPGLALEDQAKLFTPFERLSQARADGHGLGLSIVRRIVERLGGEAGVESAEGGGCTFWFTLPSV